MEAPPNVYPSKLFVNRSFVEKHFECPICRNIQKDPVQCTSGHGFCRSCIVNWKKQSSKCPTCRISLETLVPNRTVESSILESLVYCYTRLPSLPDETEDNDGDEENIQSSSSSSSSGGAAAGKKRMHESSCQINWKEARLDLCTWEGMLKDAADHFKECNYAGVKCGFEGCDKVVVRSEMVAHIMLFCPHRTFICKWFGCGQHLKAAEMNQHELVCPRRTVLCPNADAGCNVLVVYEKMDHHMGVCQFQLCPCPFADVGCRANMRRYMIEQHKHDHSVQHNDLLLKKVQEQQQLILSLKDQLRPILSDNESIVLRVKHDVLTGKEPFVSKDVRYPYRSYSEECVVRGYKALLCVEKNAPASNHYTLFLGIHGGPFPCKVDRTFEVEHYDGKSASAKKHTSTVAYDRAMAKGFNLITIAEIAAFNSPYVKDGYVTFKVTFKFV